MCQEISLDEVVAMLPRRDDTAHKGSFGHLVVLAGSPGFTGAVKLVCKAAYRSGVGLVTAAVPETVQGIIASSLVESMTFGLPATDGGTIAFASLEAIKSFLDKKSAVLIGPGLSTHPSTARLVRRFYAECPLPVVVDADGLNALAAFPERLVPRRDVTAPPCRAVFTPHPGEMGRLTGLAVDAIQRDRVGIAAYYAAAWQVVVVLKGHGTIVAAPDGSIRRCPTGNQGMATGGTGDVLAGLIGGLLAQGVAPFDATCIGTYVHGLAGDIAAREKTARAMIAGDILEALPQAWQRLERSYS